MKQQNETRPAPSSVLLGQVFCDSWNYGNEAERNAASIAAVRYAITGESPTKDELATMKLGWAAIKREIDRIRDQRERLSFVRHSAGLAGAKARWRVRPDKIVLAKDPVPAPHPACGV